MKEIVENVFHIGDSGCSVFLINTKSNDGLILVDCGMSLEMIKKIQQVNLNPLEIKHCIITHFHIDHIAACAPLKKYNKKVKFYAHDLDADAIEESGHKETAASWYGIKYKPIKLEKRLEGKREILKFGELAFQCVHIPGHTPGSIAIILEIGRPKLKILFGQDLHGPIIPGVSDYEAYQHSLKKLVKENADILCEGHFGIYRPADKVRSYIESYIES